jgi:hypothetical protein
MLRSGVISMAVASTSDPEAVRKGTIEAVRGFGGGCCGCSASSPPTTPVGNSRSVVLRLCPWIRREHERGQIDQSLYK